LHGAHRTFALGLCARGLILCLRFDALLHPRGRLLGLSFSPHSSLGFRLRLNALLSLLLDLLLNLSGVSGAAKPRAEALCGSESGAR
jgi:hypothetical protein